MQSEAGQGPSSDGEKIREEGTLKAGKWGGERDAKGKRSGAV